MIRWNGIGEVGYTGRNFRPRARRSCVNTPANRVSHRIPVTPTQQGALYIRVIGNRSAAYVPLPAEVKHRIIIGRLIGLVGCEVRMSHHIAHHVDKPIVSVSLDSRVYVPWSSGIFVTNDSVTEKRFEEVCAVIDVAHPAIHDVAFH